MSEGMNRVMLLGNLGADPEFRAGAGDGVLRLRLATTESYFDKRSNERKERTDWHNVVVFGKRGAALANLLRKGSRVFVEGNLRTSSFEKNGEKRYSTDVVATNVILNDGKRDDFPRNATPRRTERRAPAQPELTDEAEFGNRVDAEDEIPF